MDPVRLFAGFVTLFLVGSLVVAVLQGYYKTMFSVGLLCAVWIVYTSFQGPFALKRSVPGHVARRVGGKGATEQAVDDLADELSRPGTITALRSWATAVLSAQRGREIDPDSAGYPVPATDIAPPSVLADYKALLSQTPETYLHLDAAGHVDAVMLSWAHLRVGLVVVPGGLPPAIQYRFYERRPTEDIRIFCIAS